MPGEASLERLEPPGTDPGESISWNLALLKFCPKRTRAERSVLHNKKKARLCVRCAYIRVSFMWMFWTPGHCGSVLALCKRTRNLTCDMCSDLIDLLDCCFAEQLQCRNLSTRTIVCFLFIFLIPTLLRAAFSLCLAQCGGKATLEKLQDDVS